MTRYAAMLGIMAWVLLVSSAQAVGLGDITLRSALTEPLDADIRVVNPEDLTADELTVSLASAGDFRRAGVERPVFLTSLQFNVRQDGNDFLVEVTSEEAVQEPFLDFLVELRWPSGRLIREYTLLLDPPMFAPDDSGMGQVFPGADPFTSEQPSVPDVQPLSQPTPAEQARRVDQLPDSQYRVQNNDTLWEIALRARQDASQTPQQVMLAIQDLNPDAFIDGNINRVRAGRVLDLPSAEQVAVRTAAEANTDVDRQNRGLRGTPPAADAQLSASDETATGLSGAAEARDPDGFLEVVTEPSAEADETGAATGDATAEVARLENELAVQQELNDELRRQYDDQQSRLSDLEEQVTMLSRLVELQSESAAQLQAAADQLARQEADGEPAAPENGAADADGVIAPDGTGDADMDGTAVEEPAADEPVVAEAAPVVQSAPELDLRPQAQQDLLTRSIAWITAPYNAVLLLLALILVLALTNIMIKRRQAAAEDSALELDEDLLAEDSDPLDVVEDNIAPATETGAATAAPTNDALNTAPAGGAAAAAEAIENAELYMAFQRYDEAESALTTALEQSPGETSLQLKLLELYAETGDRGQFEELANRFAGDSEAVAGLRQQLLNSAVTGDFSDDLDDDGEFDDLDLSFGDDDDDSDADASLGSTENRTDYSTETTDDFSDFEMPELDDVPELDDALGTSDAEDDERSRGMDFTTEPMNEPAATETPASVDDDRLMDFDLSESDLDESAETSNLSEAGSRGDTSGDGDLGLDFDMGDIDEPEAAKAPADDKSAPADLDADLADELDLENWSDDDDFSEFAEEGDLDSPVGTSDLSEEPAEWDATTDDDLGTSEDDASTAMTAGDDEDWDEDFDFLEGADEVATKLDLARAYIDMEDPDGARDILAEVVEEGDSQQQADAKKLLDSLG